MISMDPFERRGKPGEPAMEYIWTLQRKVRELRSREGLLNLKVFVVGLLAGGGIGFVVRGWIH